MKKNKNTIPMREINSTFQERKSLEGRQVSSSQNIVVKPVINVFLNNCISNKNETSFSLQSENSQDYLRQDKFGS